MKRIITAQNFRVMPPMVTRAAASVATQQNFVVKHDQHTHIFYIDLPTGSSSNTDKSADRAVLEYEKLGDVLNLYETTVPERYQRRGIAKLLAQTAFDYAVVHKHKIQLSCTYLQKFYCENYDTYKNYVLDEDVDVE